MHLVTDGEHAHRRAFDLAESSVENNAVDAHLGTTVRHLQLPLADAYIVLHGAIGSSSQRVSTCAVCGNMSYPRTPPRRYPGSRARSRASAAGSQLTSK